MTTYNWQPLLVELNDTILTAMADEGVVKPFLRNKWLGSPPCSDKELSLLELRIGIALPISYKKFLKTVNGWGPIDDWVWRMLPAREVDWLRSKTPVFVEHPDGEMQTPLASLALSDTFLPYEPSSGPEGIRWEHLQSSLQISDVGDSAIILLNPKVRTNGEWEAWWFAPWLPGAYRYENFWELMKAQLKRIQQAS